MKIYVDKLPKSCAECPMHRSGKLKINKNGRYVEAEQCVFGQYKYQMIDDEIDTCPLQSLADHDKQVRNELIDEIEKYIHTREFDNFGLEYFRDGWAILEFLDQLRGGCDE